MSTACRGWCQPAGTASRGWVTLDGEAGLTASPRMKQRHGLTGGTGSAGNGGDLEFATYDTEGLEPAVRMISNTAAIL